MRKSTVLILYLLITEIRSQEFPTDFLSADIHRGRRQEVRKAMPSNSVAVFFGNPIRNRDNDVD